MKEHWWETNAPSNNPLNLVVERVVFLCFSLLSIKDKSINKFVNIIYLRVGKVHNLIY